MNSITKISKVNLDRISRLKVSGYEPNDYIINIGLDFLDKNRAVIGESVKVKVRPDRTTKISLKTLARIASFKISGYEPNDFIIAKALDLLEKDGKK